MINRIVAKLGIPNSCIINTPVYKKLFYENTPLSKKDKDVFVKHIESINVLFAFNKDTINLREYKDDIRVYDQIVVFLLEVTKDAKTSKIEEIVQQNIPYPIILIFKNDSSIKINVAHKRINKTDENKLIIEKSITTEWINLDRRNEIESEFLSSLSLKELNFSNCYILYLDIYFRILLLNLSEHTKEYNKYLKRDMNVIEYNFSQVTNLDKEISSLRQEIKKEQQLNRQIELNIRIKKLIKEQETIIQTL